MKSSSPHATLRVCEAADQPRSHARGRARYFRVIAVSSELGTAKPAPAIFEHALAGLGATKHAALIVGDSLSSDMQGGRNAGIATCWYNPRRQDASALVDHDIAGHDALLALVHHIAP